MAFPSDGTIAGRLDEFLNSRIGRHLRRREQKESFAIYAHGILADGERVALEQVRTLRADPRWGPVEWIWRTARPEEIRFHGERPVDAAGARACVCRVNRGPGSDADSGTNVEIAKIDSRRGLCGILQPTQDPRDLRMIYIDHLNRSRTVRYAYARVDVSEPRG
jgi:hypothetical protein